nr:melanoma-associated antigen B1-like [Cavia porcellus]
MPRGQKSKLRARQRRDQARSQARALQELDTGDAAGLPQKSPGALPTSAAAVPAASCKKFGKDHKKRESRKGKAAASKATPSTKDSNKELLLKKAELVMHYLMMRYKMKEPILKREMLKIVHKRFRVQFSEILKIASRRMELVFGLELKEIKPGGGSYTLDTMLELPGENLSSDFPKTGLLLSLLGNIFLQGCCAEEKVVWEFLNTLGIIDGTTHFIFGDVRKLITVDLVEEKYLEYRQVPGSDPPSYQFLWGPRAHEETSKVKVLEFLAKVTGCSTTDIPPGFEEDALEEKEKAESKAEAKPVATA